MFSDISAPTVTLGANLFLKGQTIPQNAKRVLFFLLNVEFTKDIYILNMDKVFDNCFFF